MQPSKQLATTLTELADEDHYLFTLSDLKCCAPGQSRTAFKTMLSRCVASGVLKRVCAGIYFFPSVKYPRGLLLYHTAARLRASSFNYISLETALSDAGVISQIPMNWITLMSSARSNIIDCGEFGSIEFIHTKKRPEQLANQLNYDPRCRMWRASVQLALRDMKDTRRNTGLIDWEAADESV